MLEGADESQPRPARVEPVPAPRDPRKATRPPGPARDHPRDAPQPAGTRRRADLAPFHGDALSDALKPSRWETPPKRGDLVFYRGKRMWVQVAHPFDVSRYVRICDHRIRAEAEPETWHDKDHRESFYVHADELALAPPVRSLTNLPTVASAARAERAKAGIRDVGDPVAVLLRDCGSLGDVYTVAATFLGVPVAELQARYSHLNPGQQRMNLGNRMRAKWRKDQ
jgi:hypothetical protein